MLKMTGAARAKIPFALAAALVLAAVSFLSCASGGALSGSAPLWVTAADDVYDSGDYLNAVGCAESRQKAEGEALSQLARSIRQNVVATSDATKLMSGNDAAGYDTSYGYSASVVTATEISGIPGVGFRETWTDSDGNVYVLAQLNREEVGRHYRKQIDANTSVVESEILYAEANSGTFEALAALRNAAAVAQRNQELMDILAGVNPDMYRLVSPDYVSAEAVSVLATREQENVAVYVAVQGDSAGRVASAFKSVLSGEGLRVTENASEARYVLDASVELAEVEGNSKYEYVRYVLSAELSDTVTRKVLVPYSENGREAHISQSEARQRAYRTVEDSVQKNYKPLLKEYLDTLR